MSTNVIDIEHLATVLDRAQHEIADTVSLSDSHDIGIDDAYRIQSGVIDRRLARGESVVGVKLGFTSEAKMAQMGVSEVIVGRLTNAMRIADGGEVDLSRFIHPKIEPEIAYRLARDVDLDDPTVDIEACVDAVAPAMEIIDSRFRDFRFSCTDVVADNTSAAAYVIGPWQPLRRVDDRAVLLQVGTDTVTGSTAAILGNPVNALQALADIARKRAIPLQRGYVILAGAATAALPLTASAVRCEVAGVGQVSVRGIE